MSKCCSIHRWADNTLRSARVRNTVGLWRT